MWFRFLSAEKHGVPLSHLFLSLSHMHMGMGGVVWDKVQACQGGKGWYTALSSVPLAVPLSFLPTFIQCGIYMHTYVCICIYVIYICTHIHVNMNIHASYESTYAYIHIHAYIRIHIYVQTYTSIRTYTYILVNTLMHTYIYIHTYIYMIHTYIHSYM